MMTYDDRKKSIWFTRKKNNNKTINKNCEKWENTMSLQPGTAGNRKQNGKPKMNKWEQVMFNIFFHNNLHFMNKTCWIMMIMAFGILMLGLYDLQVRRVLRYDQNQDERRCKKNKGCKGRTWRPWVPQNYFIFWVWKSLGQHGSPWVPGILFSWHPWVPN